MTVGVTNVNEPPTLPNNWLTAQTATVGTAFSYQFGEVTDPDRGDTVSYSAELRTGGAGTDSDPYTYGSLPSWLTFTSGSRTFSCDAAGAGACVAGTYTIRVTAGDDASTPATASAEFTLTITTGTDYDSDDDGLIEVDSLARLDAIRYDLDGDGAADSSTDDAAYAAAFPNPAANMGCPAGGCTGYELAADLTFAAWDSSNPYWNGGDGWQPITNDAEDAFEGTFDGNDNTIAGLMIDIDTARHYGAGLFGFLEGATIRDLVLADVDVSGVEAVGGLAGETASSVLLGEVVGSVSNVSVSGSVSGETSVGGLVGYNETDIVGSSSAAAVSGSDADIGGLVGTHNDGRILRSYATGAVSASGGTPRGLGGLAGASEGIIAASYATGSVSGDADVGGLVGWSDSAIIAGYATGSVSGNSNVGGLAGNLALGHSVTASFATGAVSGTGSRPATSAALRAPSTTGPAFRGS